MIHSPQNSSETIRLLGRNDPLLQELWETKALFNLEAGYSIQQLSEKANGFNLNQALEQLQSVANSNNPLGAHLV